MAEGIFNPEVVVRMKMDKEAVDRGMKQFQDKWIQTSETVRDGATVQEDYSRRLKDGSVETKSLTKQTERFRAEYLSLLFVGMAIDRMFAGQIDRMKGLTGQTAAIESFYTVAMIEPMMKISDLTFKVTDQFMSLPENVQAGAGWTMITVSGVGKTLSFLGQAYLGLAGIDKILGTSTIPKMAALLKWTYTGSSLAIGMGALLGAITQIGIVYGTFKSALEKTVSKGLSGFAQEATGQERFQFPQPSNQTTLGQALHPIETVSDIGGAAAGYINFNIGRAFNNGLFQPDFSGFDRLFAASEYRRVNG